MAKKRYEKTRQRPGYIGKFLKRADKAIEDGIQRADDILEDAVDLGKIAAVDAQKKSKELRKLANIEKEKIKSKGSKIIEKSIKLQKGLMSSSEQDLKLLAQLDKLQKDGVITKKEFEAKKKKILDRL
jgi:transcription initiation factor IIF auxiliary subunit